MATPKSIPFPAKGLNKTAGYHSQPEGTTHDALNVRPHDPIEGRLRGGRRAGLSKWLQEQVAGDASIQKMEKATRAAAFAETFRDQVLVSGDRDSNIPASVFIYDNAGNLILTYDTGSQTLGATRDVEGSYYVSGNATTSWAGNDGSSKSVWKVNTLGQVEWSFKHHNSGTTEIIYDSRFDKVFVVGTRNDDWEGATSGQNRSVWALDGQTGTLLWTYDTGSNLEFCEVDPDGNLFVCGPVTSGTSVWKFGTTGNLLATWNADTTTHCVASDDEGNILISAATASTTWDGNDGTSKNVWLLSNDLSTVQHSVSKQAGAGSFLNCDIDLDGNFVVSGGQSGGRTTVKFQPDGTELWDFDAGGTSDAVAVNGTGNVIVGASRNSNWEGNSGENRSVWYLNGETGDLTWSADTNGRAVEIGVFREPGRGAVTREISLVAVSGGNVRKITRPTIITPTDGDDAMTDTYGRLAMQNAYNKVFMVDGENSKYLDLVTNEVLDWASDVTNGTLQGESRLIALYRGRIVISGVVEDPNNWFMSRVGDPFDWDYSPATTSATDPVAGNNSEAGLVGDVVTALIPLSDDVMIFGCDSSIWQMSGDPAAGGAIDLISNQTGIAFGEAYAKDPSNALYFLGIDGVYRMRAGEFPQSLTQGRLDEEFKDLDLASNRVYMAWDFLRKALIVTVNPITNGEDEDEDDPVKVFVWDQRTDSWWQDEYPAKFGPADVYGFDAEDPQDKALLVGCRDGYIRRIDPDAEGDDGEDIENYIRMTPLMAGDPSMSLLLSGITSILGEDSGDVDLKVYTGQTAEQTADATSPRFKKVLTAGRNNSIRHRIRGHAIELELGQTNKQSRWALERLAAKIGQSGMARRHRR